MNEQSTVAGTLNAMENWMKIDKSIREEMQSVYKCKKCGEPLVVSNDKDCPWQYEKGYWTHKCSKKEEKGLRLYFFVMYNLSGIQKSIQAGHSALEYAHKYWDSEEYQRFFKDHKTFIVLDGGGSRDMLTRIKELESFGFNFASFQEPDLNGSTSAIAFLVPEDIYNFDEESYISNPFRMNCFLPYPTKEEKVELQIKSNQYKAYKWLKSFRLAAN